jgi:hypothetical protein
VEGFKAYIFECPYFFYLFLCLAEKKIQPLKNIHPIKITPHQHHLSPLHLYFCFPKCSVGIVFFFFSFFLWFFSFLLFFKLLWLGRFALRGACFRSRIFRISFCRFGHQKTVKKILFHVKQPADKYDNNVFFLLTNGSVSGSLKSGFAG